MSSAAFTLNRNYALRNTRYSVRTTLIIALAAGISRLLFVRATPINWDAVQFALAVDEFDLHAHQPHPPGYILYVLAARALDLLDGNPSLALAFLSVLCSALVVPIIYWLALSIFEDRPIALGAAFLTLSSPLALYYGAVGLTYLPEMLLSVCVGGLAWRAKYVTQLRHEVASQADDCHTERSEESVRERSHQGSRFFASLSMTERKGTRKAGPEIRAAYLIVWLGIALGVAGGIRQTSLLVLFPVCLWAIWGMKRKALALFSGSLAATCTLWLLPLLAMSGGIEPYVRESALLAQTASSRTSILTAGLDGLAYNVSSEALALVLGLAFGAIPLGLWATRTLRFSLAPRLRAFLCWWGLPPLLLYAVSHVGQYGYLLVVVPPFLLLSALCVRVLSHKLRREHSNDAAKWTVLASGMLSLLSTGYFLFAEGPTTLSNINRNHTHWQELRRAMSGMDPGSTALIMSVKWNGPFRLAGYLLPEFHAYAAEEGPVYPVGWLYSAYGGRSDYALPRPQPQHYLSLPPGTTRVVGLDDATGAMLARGNSTRRVSLQDGSTLYILDSAPADIKGLTIQEGVIRVVDRR